MMTKNLLSYHSDIDAIIDNMKKGSQKLGNEFKQQLRKTVENTVKNHVNSFFQEKQNNISPSSDWADEFYTPLNTVISTAITTLMNETTLQAALQQVSINIAQERDVLEARSLNLVEEVTLCFSSKINSCDFEELHNITTNILRKVMGFHENLMLSTSPLLLKPTDFSFRVFPSTLGVEKSELLPEIIKNILKLIKDIFIMAITLRSFLSVIAAVMVFSPKGLIYDSVLSNIITAVALGMIVSVIFTGIIIVFAGVAHLIDRLFTDRGDQQERYKLNLIEEINIQYCSYLNKYYVIVDDYTFTSKINILQNDISSEFTKLITIINKTK